jgi:hypothetical protein
MCNLFGSLRGVQASPEPCNCNSNPGTTCASKGLFSKAADEAKLTRTGSPVNKVRGCQPWCAQIIRREVNQSANHMYMCDRECVGR